MQRLFWKLFGAFWLTTVVILAVTVFMSFRIADEQAERTFADPREVDAELQAILQADGIDGLSRYVSDPENFPAGQTVYLIEPGGEDLLGRRVPERVQRWSRRMWQTIDERGPERRGFDRRQRRLQQALLETADGSLLLAMQGPSPPPRFGVLSSGTSRWVVLVMAAVISFAGFFWLSRSLTGPVARISTTAARLAEGDLTARVGPPAYSKDEIGQLAVQFDRMAAELDSQSRNRRELFRNMAHELRAPLTRLQIASELLESKPANSVENLERIRYEIARIENLASQVLALARAEESPDACSVTELNEVIASLSADAKFEADAHGVRFRCDLPRSKLTIRGNPDSVASAIENVVRNAIQNTPAGGNVTLRIKDADSCTVIVEDTGPGVPDDDLDTMFEPFYRIDTNRPGAGIGLAITRRVLQQFGGEVHAMNRPEGGLQVTMRFTRA